MGIRGSLTRMLAIFAVERVRRRSHTGSASNRAGPTRNSQCWFDSDPADDSPKVNQAAKLPAGSSTVEHFPAKEEVSPSRLAHSDAENSSAAVRDVSLANSRASRFVPIPVCGTPSPTYRRRDQVLAGGCAAILRQLTGGSGSSMWAPHAALAVRHPRRDVGFSTAGSRCLDLRFAVRPGCAFGQSSPRRRPVWRW